MNHSSTSWDRFRTAGQKARIPIFILLFLCIGEASSRAEHPADEIEPLLTQFCLDCHNAESREAEIDLSDFANPDAFVLDRQTWRRVVEVLESGQMPPEDPIPTFADRQNLTQWVRQSLDSVDWYEHRAPGRVALARMTRVEYQHSINDLFGVAVELDKILPDDPEGLSGFANDRSSLMMTGNQLWNYLRAAEVAAATIVDHQFAEPFVRHHEIEEGQNASAQRSPSQSDDGSMGWSFSSRLGDKYQSVSQSFDFPRTGRYQIRIRARSKGPGPNAGIWVALDSVNEASREQGCLVTSTEFQIYETDLFITAGRHSVLLGYDFYRPLWLPAPPERPQLKLGQSTFDPPPYDASGLLPDHVKLDELIDLGFNAPNADIAEIDELLAVINEGYYPAILDRLMLYQFHYEQGYLPVFLGGFSYHYTENVLPAFAQLADIFDTEQATLKAVWDSRKPDAYRELEETMALQREAWNRQNDSRIQEVGDLFVDWIEIESITSDSQLPTVSNEVSAYLDQLLPRAMRRPVEETTKQQFLSIYHRERVAGASHRQGLERLLISLFVSPEFLFRSDGPAVEPGIVALDNHALAARLASFVWCSLPDDQLASIASEQELQRESVLSAQIERMLNDQRSKRMVAQFTTQWMDLSGIGREREPDKELFRYFSWQLAEDMRTEVALLFERMLREDRSILELLDSEDTFANERLARLYGIPDVTGAEFRPVTFNDDRGGLLGTSAVLTTTSLATRTSPVRRGHFILETLLDVDLPPPPPSVAELDEQAGQSRDVSLRESLARHRRDPQCAGCHSKIDPLGFALEGYDWIGRQRDRDPAGPIDATGTMPNGHQLTGLAELKRYLVEERADDFTRALTKSLLTYALGRELDYYDEYAVQQIAQTVKDNDYRSRILIREIVMSYPFRYRQVEAADLTIEFTSPEQRE